jgi:hypothetical protein
LVQRGQFDFFTKKNAQGIRKDLRGSLKFPRPSNHGICPMITGDLWRAYKEISKPKKKEFREAQMEKVEKKRSEKRNEV